MPAMPALPTGAYSYVQVPTRAYTKCAAAHAQSKIFGGDIDIWHKGYHSVPNPVHLGNWPVTSRVVVVVAVVVVVVV